MSLIFFSPTLQILRQSARALFEHQAHDALQSAFRYGGRPGQTDPYSLPTK